MSDYRNPGQRVLTAADVEAEIMRLSDAMEVELGHMADQARQAAEAQHAYKVGFAKRRLEAGYEEGNGRGGRTTVGEREDMALRDTEEQYKAALIAEALYDTAKERGRTRRSQIDALRTISANIRAQS